MDKKEINVPLLDKALDYVYDILDRCSIEYMLLGDTAYSIVRDTIPKVQKISLGVKKKDLTEFAYRILELTVPGAVIDEHKIKFNSPEGVPIEIRIITKDYPFFNHPDTILFRMDTYHIPNPFDNYWKVYRLIQ